MIDSGGTDNVFGSAFGTRASSGLQFVHDGGTASGTVISQRHGYQDMLIASVADAAWGIDCCVPQGPGGLLN
jgi:hypothetical protein